MAYFSEVKFYNQGEVAIVEASDASLAEIVEHVTKLGVDMKEVSVNPECDCDPVYGGFPERHVELTWKVV